MRSLAPESAVVQMAAQPREVPSWQSAAEWLPELVYESDRGRVLGELGGRRASTWARTGYLLQGMRPDVAEVIMGASPPASKVRFGPRAPSFSGASGTHAPFGGGIFSCRQREAKEAQRGFR